MKKLTIETLCAILCALAVMLTIAALLPEPVYSQAGTGPRGEKFYDYSQAIVAIPTNLDPSVTSRSCTKDGVFGLQNGVLYICVSGIWNKVTLATVTPTATATATPTP